MTIQLMKNNSDDIVVNKNINFITELTGTLRDRCDLLNPAILIEMGDYLSLFSTMDVAYNDDILVEYDEFEVTVNSDNLSLFKINYAYIPEFERYYFIDNIEIYNKNLYILYMSVDDLMSHKDNLLNETALIERNEFTYDLTLEDTMMLYENKIDVKIEGVDTSSNTFNFNQTPPVFESTYLLTYYTSVAENENEQSSNVVESNLPKVTSSMGGYSKFTSFMTLAQPTLAVLSDFVTTHESDSSFIISIIAYPFELPRKNELRQVYLGNNVVKVEYEGNTRFCEGSRLRKDVSDYLLLGKFKINKESYLDLEPYTTYEIYLPFVGYVGLKSADILDYEIRIYYVIDFANGSGKAIIYNHDLNYVISSYNVTVGIKLPVNRTNAQELNDSKIQAGINVATSTLSGVVAGAIKGGVAGAVVGGALGLGLSSYKAVESLAFMHEKAQANIRSGFEGVYSPLDIFIKKTKYVTRDVTNYNHYYGRPLNKTDKLINYKGYTIVSDIYLDDLDALDKEKEVIKSLLKSGIIL